MAKTKTNSEDYLRMYRQMVRIRTFEDNANQLYLSAKMPGLTHMYSGEEAVAVGICEALTDDRQDHLDPPRPRPLRGQGRGLQGDVLRTSGQGRRLLPRQGRLDAYRRPVQRQPWRQRHRRRLDGDRHRLGALRAKLLGKDDVTVCFFGDGATAQGLMYEVMNMAALWNLPVIYACENNGYSEYTKTDEIAAGSITARAEAFGIEAHQVDGQDVLAVNELANDLVARARKGEGPFFIELMTYRYHGHHVGDINREYYRTKDEEKDWKDNRDPIIRFRRLLVSEGIATEDEIEAMNAEIDRRRRGRRRIRAGRQIPRRVRSRHARLFRHQTRAGLRRRHDERDHPVPGRERGHSPRKCAATTPCSSSAKTWPRRARRSRSCPVWSRNSAPSRVIDTPIAEPGFMGLAVGAAMTGTRPVVDLMFGDFIFLIMDQLCNQAAKTHYMSGGKLSVPLVLRTNMGATRRSAAQH